MLNVRALTLLDERQEGHPACKKFDDILTGALPVL